MRRRLSAEEQALWRRVVADVTPLRGTPNDPAALRIPVRTEPVEAPSSPARLKAEQSFGKSKTNGIAAKASSARPVRPANTLDASWDRRLARGLAAPDRIVDLHGHTLASAHALLEAALGRAVAAGDRVLLIVAGRDRPGPGRGAIRREVGSWIAGSRHAARVAAVRAAHPRHGGAGAFYLVLRRAGETRAEPER